MRNLCRDQLLIEGELCVLHRVVGRGENRIDLLRNQRIHRRIEFVRGRTRLLDVANAVCIEVSLCILNRLLGAVLALGIQKANILGVRVGRENQLHDCIRVQAVRGAGDIAARCVQILHELCADRIGNRREDNRCLGMALDRGLHNLCRRRCERNNHIDLVVEEFCRHLIQGRGIALAVQRVGLVLIANFVV